MITNSRESKYNLYKLNWSTQNNSRAEASKAKNQKPV